MRPTVENIPDRTQQQDVSSHDAGPFYFCVIAACDIVILCLPSQQCNMLCLHQGSGHQYWGLSGAPADQVLQGDGVVLQNLERTGGQSHRYIARGVGEGVGVGVEGEGGGGGGGYNKRDR